MAHPHDEPEAIAPYIQDHDVLLENHGALTLGADLIGAYYKMETVELFAKINPWLISSAGRGRSRRRTSISSSNSAAITA